MATGINFCLGLILIVLSCQSCHSKPFYVDYEDVIEDPLELYSSLIQNSKSQNEAMAAAAPYSPSVQDQDKSGPSAPAVKRTQAEMIPEEFDPSTSANSNNNNNNNEVWLSSKNSNNADNSWNEKLGDGIGQTKKSVSGRLGIKKGSLAGGNNGLKINSRPIRRYRYRKAGGFGGYDMKNANAQRYLSAPSPSVFSYSSGFHSYGDGNGKSDPTGFSKRQSILYRQCFFNPISCFRK